MILAAHITIAIASIAYTTFLNLRPDRSKLNLAYGLVAGTLISGTYLVISMHSALVQSCATGLIYLGAVSANLIAARHKLAKQEQQT